MLANHDTNHAWDSDISYFWIVASSAKVWGHDEILFEDTALSN